MLYRGAYLVPAARSSTINLISGPDTSACIDAIDSKAGALFCHANRTSITRVEAALAFAGAIAYYAIRIACLSFVVALLHPLRICTDRSIIEIARRRG